MAMYIHPRMTIKTKSIYQPKEADDGLRVLITRFYPRGVRKDHFDLWLRELSPSAALLQEYKQDRVSWSDFKIAFLSEVRDNVESLDVIYALNDQSRFSKITLLCYEKDGQPCHRHLMRDIVESPELLRCSFEPKDAYDHECVSEKKLIPYKKSLDFPILHAKT